MLANNTAMAVANGIKSKTEHPTVSKEEYDGADKRKTAPTAVTTTTKATYAAATASTIPTTTTTTTTTGSKIGDSSLLAPSFVPQHLRQINYLPITQAINAQDPPNLQEHIERIYNTSVARCACMCKDKHDKKKTWKLGPKLPTELYYALGPTAQKRSDRNFHRNFKTAEDANGRADYIQIFHLLLRDETEEKMVLYERYSQYNASVQADPNRPGRAMMEIPGIHNARPPIQPGDKLLFRPQTPVFLQNYAGNGLMLPPQQLPDHVEIRSEVIRTVRGTYNSKEDRIRNDIVIFTWILDPRLVQFFASCQFTVRFVPSNSDHQRSLAALLWLNTINPVIAKELLFPTKKPILPDHYNESLSSSSSPSENNVQHLGKDLNEKQSDFVNMILTRTAHPSMDLVRPPMVLTGPAGTGKTKTLLVSILKTLEMKEGSYERRILVCTPSHTAADVLCLRLGKFLSSRKLFRMYESGRPVEMVPTEILQFTRQGTMGEFVLPTAEDLLRFQVIVCTCSDAHILNMAGLTNARLRIRRNCLDKFIRKQIEMSHLSMKGEIVGLQEPHFTHLFIDEAAQATEPETLIPFSVVVDDQPNVIKVEIALAGDPRQLNPTINSRWAAKGLQTSLLERLLRLPSLGGRSHMLGPPTNDTWTNMDELIEYSFQKKDDHQNLSVFLTTSYRGHPSFLMVPSKLFYFDKLRSINSIVDGCEDKWCSLLRKIESMSTGVHPPNCTKQNSWPIHFRGVLGHDSSVAVESFWGSNSWSNELEALEILQIVRTMVLEGISTQSIGIMAAFRAQVVLIRRILRDSNLGTVNVGMVEDYQSVEREVIILSLTRSNESFLPPDITRRVGLYMQPKRMNVALTRAENLLVVVGNPTLMQKDTFWREWLQFCYHSGLWYGERGDGTFSFS